MTSGDPETHYYKMAGIFPPTLTTGSASLAEAEADLQIVRQKRNSYIPIMIDDQNSTQAKIYVTDFFTADKTMASYVIDTEGNRSATRYYGIDFRGL